MPNNAGRLPSEESVQLKLHGNRPLSVYDAMVALDEGEHTIRSAIRSGELASIQLGRNIKVPASAVRRLLCIE